MIQIFIFLLFLIVIDIMSCPLPPWVLPPCRHGMTSEPILNQYYLFRAEPILNEPWTMTERWLNQSYLSRLHVEQCRLIQELCRGTEVMRVTDNDGVTDIMNDARDKDITDVTNDAVGSIWAVEVWMLWELWTLWELQTLHSGDISAFLIYHHCFAKAVYS